MDGFNIEDPDPPTPFSPRSALVAPTRVGPTGGLAYPPFLVRQAGMKRLTNRVGPSFVLVLACFFPRDPDVGLSVLVADQYDRHAIHQNRSS
jgi:hypothetical protein